MDKISNLPDLVLSHILSLLPTKLAVSTCVLSKRWQFLWTMIHNLDFVCDPHISLSQNQKKHFEMRFVKFVNRFFTLRDKHLCLKMFSLKYVAPNCSSKHVHPWILAAMSSGVENFVLEIIPKGSFPFRCSVFSCKTLVVLKLLENVLIDAPPSSIHFPSLKLLYLYNVEFENQNSFNNLFSGCPVLENLEIYINVDLDEFCDFVISSSTLRRLVVHSYSESEPIRLSVDAPSLKYLNLHLVASRDIYLKNLHNLEVAKVRFESANGDFSDSQFRSMVEDAFVALYNVRDLELSFSIVLGLRDASFEGFPLFHNLVQLKLDGFCCCWRTLLCVVQKLPFLQHLTILYSCCEDECSAYLGSESWAELYVSNCLSHLKTLCVYGRGLLYDDENLCGDFMEFLTNVLKNSKVLDIVSVTMYEPRKKEQKEAFKQKIASLERASKKCKLTFDGQVL